MMEAKERSMKDELKQRRENASQELTQNIRKCAECGCGFVGRSKAGLVNHIRQKHSRAAQCLHRCPHCGRLF